VSEPGRPLVSRASRHAMILRSWVSPEVVVASVCWTAVLAGRLQDHHLGFSQNLHRQNAGSRPRRPARLIARSPWDSLFSRPTGFSISFLEEMWAPISQPDMRPAKADRFLIALRGMSRSARVAHADDRCWRYSLSFQWSMHRPAADRLLLNLIFTTVGWHGGPAGAAQGPGPEGIVWSAEVRRDAAGPAFSPETVPCAHWLNMSPALHADLLFEGIGRC